MEHRLGLPAVVARGRHLHNPTADRHTRSVQARAMKVHLILGWGSTPWRNRPPLASRSRSPSWPCAAPGGAGPVRHARRSTARCAVIVDVGLPHPVAQARLGDAELVGDLGERLLPQPGEFYGPLAELRRVGALGMWTSFQATPLGASGSVSAGAGEAHSRAGQGLNRTLSSPERDHSHILSSCFEARSSEWRFLPR